MNISIVLILFSAPNYLCHQDGLLFSLEKEDASFTGDNKPIINATVSSETSCFLKCLNHEKCCWLQVVKTTMSDNWIICRLFQMIDIIASVNYKTEKASNIFHVEEGKRCLPPLPPPKDCLDWFKRGFTTDGVYRINVSGTITNALCDMTTDRGGWTVFQKRINGTVSFDRTWEEYKSGFGDDVEGEHWLGNDVLHQLTTSTASAANPNTLIRLEGTSFGGETKHVTFKGFLVEGEANKYKLHTGVFENGNIETLGVNWLNHNQMFFSTKDQDNDNNGDDHCGRSYTSGWWFNTCLSMNPNGKYSKVESLNSAHGIVWFEWLGYKTALKSFKMSLKRIH